MIDVDVIISKVVCSVNLRIIDSIINKFVFTRRGVFTKNNKIGLVCERYRCNLYVPMYVRFIKLGAMLIHESNKKE